MKESDTKWNCSDDEIRTQPPSGTVENGAGATFKCIRGADVISIPFLCVEGVWIK